jgi:hypothetical protein
MKPQPTNVPVFITNNMHEHRKALLEELHLKLNRRRCYNFLTHIRGNKGLFDVCNILAQRKIKNDIHKLEQRYEDNIRLKYQGNRFDETCEKCLYSDWLNEQEFRKFCSMGRVN